MVVFEGTAREMLLESIKANNQDKLSMTAKDKLESAWTIWVAMIDVEKQFATVKSLGVSNGTLSNFKATQEWYGNESESLQYFTWKEVRKLMMTSSKQMDFDEDELARIWSQDLFQKFGHKGKQSSSVFFEAIRIYMGEQKFSSQIDYYAQSLECEDEELEF